MPASRGRKPRKGPKARTVRTSPAMPPRGSTSFVPGAFRDNKDALVKVLQGAPGEALPVLFLPMLWTTMAKGVLGNVCVSACATVAEAYAHFGIAAQLIPVSLVIEPVGGGPATSYGTERPHWADETTFVGHVVLDLPSSGRFVDVTIEQFPGVRRLKMGPLIGRNPDEHRTASLRRGVDYQFTVPRGDLLIHYGAVDPDCADVLAGAPALTHYRADYQRTGRNLASQALAAFHSSADLEQLGPAGKGPTVSERLRSSPHRRLIALLDALGDGEFQVDQDGDWRLLAAGTHGDSRLLRLDEIPLPGFPPV